jgi:GT2 family glycosyltransferase
MTFSNPKIFICIPIFNRISLTIQCLASIERSSYKNVQVIICDDGSTDNSSEVIKKKFPEVIIVYGDGNLFWTGATAMAVDKALELGDKSDLVFTLNNDTELLFDTLQLLVEYHLNNPISIIGALNVFYDNPNKIEPSAFVKKGGFFLPEFQLEVHKYGELINNKKEIIEVDSLSGKGVLIPIGVFEKTGNYNFEMIPHYFGDTEFTIRAQRNGYKIYLHTIPRVLSHVEETGVGTIKNKTTFRKYIKSFKDVRSENYLPSIKNRAKLVYTNNWRLYFAINVLFRFLKNIKNIKL